MLHTLPTNHIYQRLHLKIRCCVLSPLPAAEMDDAISLTVRLSSIVLAISRPFRPAPRHGGPTAGIMSQMEGKWRGGHCVSQCLYGSPLHIYTRWHNIVLARLYNLFPGLKLLLICCLCRRTVMCGWSTFMCCTRRNLFDAILKPV